MNSILIDNELRNGLHSIYLAQFHAIKRHPTAFDKNDATRMLTGLMGSRPWSWRVVGITPVALDIFAQNGFLRVKGLVERGHLVERNKTALHLYFERQDPMEINEFYEYFLERDRTVLMAKYENKARMNEPLPDYIPIPAELELFPSGSLVGWKHRKLEEEFLRSLHASRSVA